jgi:cobalt-zinc-cadmium resistance protein CzcA
MKKISQRLYILFVLISISAQAQTLTREQAIETALQNNQQIKSAEFEVEYFKQMKKTGSDLGKFSAMWMSGQYNTIETDNNFTFSQSIPFPTAIGAHTRLKKEQVTGSQMNLAVVQNTLVYEVKSLYEQLVYQQALHTLLMSQDSLFTDFARASALRYKAGESTLLEKTTAETQLQEVKNQLRKNETDLVILQSKLKTLLKSETTFLPSEELTKLTLSTDTVTNNPQLSYMNQQVVIANQNKRAEKSGLLPDITVGYFNQSLIGFQNVSGQEVYYDKNKRFQGFQLGVSIPLWFGPQVAKSKAAGFQEEATRKSAEFFQATLIGELEQTQKELEKDEASLQYYETSALQNANLILQQAGKAYRGGEIGYIEFLQSVQSAQTIKANYVMALTQYNQSVIKMDFLLGKN